MRRTPFARAIGLLFVTSALVAVATSAAAQAPSAAAERFTFQPANFPGAPPMNLVIRQWSSDADRDRIVTAASNGPKELSHPIASSYAIGYVEWPGALQYILRYAARTTRPDGTQDIVLATDRPMTVWWDGAPKPGAAAEGAYTVIQLRLDKSGKGEGKLSIAENVAADKTAKTIVIEDFGTRPTLLTNVQRAAGDSNTD
jgi:hypothetical protein